MSTRNSSSKVFGIGGVTCGGKTTLANLLHEEFPGSSVLHQDDYYWPESHPYWKNDGTDNWDDISAFDMDRLVSDVLGEMGRGAEYVFVEGIMLYEDARLSGLFTHKVFLTLPFDECKRRRVLRNYQPPEPYPEYFEEKYWPVYEQQLLVAKATYGIEFLDSTQPLGTLKKLLSDAVIHTV